MKYMIRNLLIVISIFIFCSFAFIAKTGEEKGIYTNDKFIGKKIQNTDRKSTRLNSSH